MAGDRMMYGQIARRQMFQMSLASMRSQTSISNRHEMSLRVLLYAEPTPIFAQPGSPASTCLFCRRVRMAGVFTRFQHRNNRVVQKCKKLYWRGPLAAMATRFR